MESLSYRTMLVCQFQLQKCETMALVPGTHYILCQCEALHNSSKILNPGLISNDKSFNSHTGYHSNKKQEGYFGNAHRLQSFQIKISSCEHEIIWQCFSNVVQGLFC